MVSTFFVFGTLFVVFSCYIRVAMFGRLIDNEIDRVDKNNTSDIWNPIPYPNINKCYDNFKWYAIWTPLKSYIEFEGNDND